MREGISERQLRAAARSAQVERWAARSIAHINDRLVPAVRAGGLRAMRHASRLLRRSADLLDAKARP